MTVQNQRSDISAAIKTNADGRTSKLPRYVDVLVVISNFCKETSVHGLGQVIKHTVAIAKVVWLIAFFGAVIGNAYHISTLVNLYLDYPIQEVTKTQYGPISFPDVTVCNLNPISISNYERVLENKSSRLSRYLDRIHAMFKSGFLTDQEQDQYLTITSIQINIGMEESMTIGHQIHDFVLRCTFKGQPCNISSQFKLVMNSLLYNCYTFLPGEMGDHFLATGAENGLSLILYLEANNGTEIHSQYDSTLNSGNALGVKIMIHPRDSYPIPHIDGLDAMPGHSTSIAFKVTRTKKLPRPHGDCIYNKTLSGMEDYEYSATLCSDVCLQRRFIDICRCKSVHQPMLDCEYSVPYCGTFPDDEDVQRVIDHVEREKACRKKVWIEFIDDQKIRDACGCRARCFEYLYTYTISESLWPAPKYHESFIERELLYRDDRLELKAFNELGIVPSSITNSTHNHSTYNLVAENFARLNVYLTDQESLLREQKPAYPISKLFSDIGGTLGLWVGISLLTLIELLQLGIRMLLVICGKHVD